MALQKIATTDEERQRWANRTRILIQGYGDTGSLKAQRDFELAQAGIAKRIAINYAVAAGAFAGAGAIPVAFGALTGAGITAGGAAVGTMAITAPLVWGEFNGVGVTDAVRQLMTEALPKEIKTNDDKGLASFFEASAMMIAQVGGGSNLSKVDGKKMVTGLKNGYERMTKFFVPDDPLMSVDLKGAFTKRAVKLLVQNTESGLREAAENAKGGPGWVWGSGKATKTPPKLLGPGKGVSLDPGVNPNMAWSDDEVQFWKMLKPNISASGPAKLERTRLEMERMLAVVDDFTERAGVTISRDTTLKTELGKSYMEYLQAHFGKRANILYDHMLKLAKQTAANKTY